MHEMEIDEKRIRMTVSVCQDQLEKNVIRHETIAKILIGQLTYISPVFYLFQLAALIAAALLSGYFKTGIEPAIPGVLFVGMLAIPEVMKDFFFETGEMEYACRFSPARMCAYRLCAVYMINLSVMSLCAVFVKESLKLTFIRTVCMFALPYSVFMILSLLLCSFMQSKGRMFIIVLMIAAAAFTSILFITCARSLLLSRNIYIYTASAAALHIFCTKLFVNERKKVQLLWN